MAAILTRFEIQLPLFSDGTPEQTAVNTFVANMSGLTNVVNYNAYVTHSDATVTQCNVLYGLLTVLQQTTALGLLTTLNTALGSNVLCTVNSVTQEP
jgi:hypothetical protein